MDNDQRASTLAAEQVVNIDMEPQVVLAKLEAIAGRDGSEAAGQELNQTLDGFKDYKLSTRLELRRYMHQNESSFPNLVEAARKDGTLGNLLWCKSQGWNVPSYDFIGNTDEVIQKALNEPAQEETAVVLQTPTTPSSERTLNREFRFVTPSILSRRFGKRSRIHRHREKARMLSSPMCHLPSPATRTSQTLSRFHKGAFNKRWLVTRTTNIIHTTMGPGGDGETHSKMSHTVWVSGMDTPQTKSFSFTRRWSSNPAAKEASKA